MNHLPEHIADLIFLYLNESISVEQQITLDNWVAQSTYNKLILERVLNQDSFTKEFTTFRKIDKERAWENLMEIVEPKANEPLQIEMRPPNSNKRMRITWWAAACLVIGLLCFSYYTIHLKKHQREQASLAKINIPPGKEGAVLTLANGNQVSLDSLKNGEVEIQRGVKAKLVNGILVYENRTGSPVFNTVHTPKSRQYELILPDGTKVWLNAMSAIRFPTQFIGKERKVELLGEAYFEVAKNRSTPFKIVMKNKAEVVVLGTHFNINSYDNEENISTTLLEGAVNVVYNSQKITLIPGQQAQIRRLNPSAKIEVTDKIDLEKVTAWKNGIFNFEGMEFNEIMRQLERWYDIDVVYEGSLPKSRFFGEISRKENLADVLTALEESHIRFRLEEGRRLIVLGN